MKVLALFEVDPEKLKSEAENESLEEAFQNEMGWVEDSGIELTSYIIDPSQKVLNTFSGGKYEFYN